MTFTLSDAKINITYIIFNNLQCEKDLAMHKGGEYMSVSILHISDTHLGTSVSHFSAEKNMIRTHEIEHTTINILKSCSKYDIVLMTGDIFDSPNTHTHIAEMVLDAIASCPDTRFFYSCGNHDPYISPVIDYCVQNCPDNLYIFGYETPEKVVLDKLGVCVWGMSFSNQYHTSPLVSEALPCDETYINIMCLHGEINDASSYNPVSVSLFEKSGFDYLALGHVHTHSGIMKSGALSYAYPGIPEPRGFDETGEKGYIKGTIEKGFANLSFVPFSKRKYIEKEIDISDITSFSALASEITSSTLQKDNIYRIILKGENKISSVLSTDSLVTFTDAFYTVITDSSTVCVSLDEFSEELTLKGQCARETLSMIQEDATKKELYTKAFSLLSDLFDEKGGAV